MGVVLDNNVKMSMNPFCEIGVEAAVQLKEAKIANEIICVSIGDKKSQDVIRTALALGCDKGIHINTDKDIDLAGIPPLTVSEILANICKKYEIDACILGKQSIDGDYGQTGAMLASKLDWSQFTFASDINMNNNDIEVIREIDGGLQTLKSSLPAIITTDLRLNEPRYATLPNIMKARKKPMEQFELNDFIKEDQPHIKTIEVNDPPVRKAGIMVETVDELVDKLKNEAKVI